MNDEYQRQIVIRLKEISDWMLSEFDYYSENYWGKNSYYIKDQLEGYLEQRKRTKEKYFLEYFGIDPWLWKQYQMASKIKYDPFVPKDIRKSIYALYFNRMIKMTDVLEDTLDKLLSRLDESNGQRDEKEYLEFVESNLIEGYEKAEVNFHHIEKKIKWNVRKIEAYLSSLD